MNRIRRFFTDSDGKWAVVQMPNSPIIAFVVFKLGALLASGQLAVILQHLADASLLIWAGWELAAGDSWFRRLLGLVVVFWLIAKQLM